MLESSIRPSIIHGPLTEIVPESFGELLRRQASHHGPKVLVYSDHQARGLTFAEADCRSEALAHGLTNLGIRKGDPVSVLMGNMVEYIELFFACAKVGALFTLLNYGYSEGELHSVLNQCGAKALVMVTQVGKNDYRGWLPRLKPSIRSLQHVILVDAAAMSISNELRYEDIVAQGLNSGLLSGPSIDPDDILNLQFTSGSTGKPKAAALSHRNIHQAAIMIGETMSLQPTDKVCLPVPLFHSFGLIIGLATVSCRGASIVMPSETFEVEATLRSIGSNRCTGIYGVTTMFVVEMEHERFHLYDLTSLKFAVIAGSAAPESLVRRLRSKFGISQTYSNWGLTESASICTMTRKDDTIEKQIHTSGTPFPGTSVKVVDPHTNRAVPWGEKGELVLRGHQVQKGYYKNEVKTKEAHKLSLEDGLVWFHTGDEGFLDPDGFVCITGRIKDMIIRGGENISPLEIEERLIAHPKVAQVAVIGVPDSRYGEHIAAFLEGTQSGGPRPSDEEMKTWVRQKLAVFKQPKYFWWLDTKGELFHSWPKTGSGKLRKPDLRVIADKFLKPEGSYRESKL